jgi:hypothetical protein
MRAVFDDDDAMQELARRDGLEVLRPQLGIKPRVYYRNLYRYTACFIGGSAAVDRSGVIDCLAGARARLFKQGKPVAEALTDTFGDFKFDGLAPQSGAFEVEVSHAECDAVRVQVDLGRESRYVGEVRLHARR